MMQLQELRKIRGLQLWGKISNFFRLIILSSLRIRTREYWGLNQLLSVVFVANDGYLNISLH